MSPATDTTRSPRRMPSSGVSGVTLLMLVTLVLTTSPALGAGRARDATLADQTRQDLTAAPRCTSPRAEPRIGGRRDQASRDTRPGSGEAVLQSTSDPVAMRTVAEAYAVPAAAPAFAPTTRVRVALLNLPPPVA